MLSSIVLLSSLRDLLFYSGTSLAKKANFYLYTSRDLLPTAICSLLSAALLSCDCMSASAKAKRTDSPFCFALPATQLCLPAPPACTVSLNPVPYLGIEAPLRNILKNHMACVRVCIQDCDHSWDNWMLIKYFCTLFYSMFWLHMQIHEHNE